ncbi:PepSY domain-containing protein [Pseudoduganella sp. UC29_71]|uniref:PepSY domain-containing protein n=1 Tax=Pseudoduganella sp. UC29_71 TaxID=3350174 RepID=UPI00366BA5BC
MKPAFWSRRLHKWLGLLVGLQALLWMVSGLYMTAISIEIIHGDHLAHLEEGELRPAELAASPTQITSPYAGVTGFRLKQSQGSELYQVRYADGVALVNARTGQRLAPLDEKAVRALALSYYQGEGELERLQLLTELPGEVAKRKGPLWRAEFSDGNGTTLYISPSTGDLVAKRHTLWRIFDFLWMLHIMDYDTRDNINNNLLRVAATAGTLFAFSGIWLLWFSFRRRATA